MEIKTRCKQGWLTVSDTMITVQLADLNSHSMPRNQLVGLDSTVAVPSLFGLGGGQNLVFRGQGTMVIEAGFVATKDAKQIKKLLGY